MGIKTDCFAYKKNLNKCGALEILYCKDGDCVVLQIIYGSMLHFIYNHFQDYPECHITLFKPNSAH